MGKRNRGKTRKKKNKNNNKNIIKKNETIKNRK